MSDDARARLDAFVEELAEATGPANRIVVAQVDSTNRLARRIVATYQAEEIDSPELWLLSLEQTDGRGRRGRPWASPPGAGVYATRVLPLPEQSQEERVETLQSIPLLVAVGLAGAIGRILGGDGPDPAKASACRLKWPNDVLVEGAKIGGILAESLAIGSGPPVALLGFGVNHTRPRVGEELPALPIGATALADHVESPPSLGAFARALMAGVEAEIEHLGDLPRVVPSYRELSAHREGDTLRCRTGDHRLEGTFAGFDERGHLRLRQGDETVLLTAGEIVEDRTDDD